jgi:uncharacterized protein YbaP (TraB family)
MRLLLSGFLAVLLLAVPARSREPSPDPPPVAPALWVVRDADTTIYLFGTVHVLPRGVDWFRRHVVEALDRSDTLILEARIPEDPMAMLGLTLRMARRAEIWPLAERVPEDRRAALLSAVERLNPGPLDQFDTWYIALTLANLESRAAGFDTATGVEAVLTERARLGKLRIEALETPEQQLTYFDALSEADQRQLLLGTLDGLATTRADTEATISAWLKGDKDALAARINREFEGSPMLKQMLLGDRNARWAETLAKRMAVPGTVFVAVGAGHLAGPNSLIADLERYGLVVERVRETAPPPKPARRRR